MKAEEQKFDVAQIVPQGYEVDKEKSTFETIVFKKKKGLSTEDISMSVCEHQMAELWYVTEDGEPFQLEHQSKCCICGYEDNRI